jgi:hypothetical protein
VTGRTWISTRVPYISGRRESNPLEAHAEGALLRPHGAQTAQAQIQMFAPKFLQIKVAYFIVAGAGAGSTAWGIHDLIQSNNWVESPAKP